MTKVFALYSYLDIESMIGNRDLKFIDLRIETNPYWFEDSPVKEIKQFVELLMEREFYDFIVVNLDLDIVKELIELDIDITLIYPSINLDPEYILKRKKAFKDLNLSSFSRNHFVISYGSKHAEVKKILDYTKNKSTVIFEIILRTAKDLNQYPGYINKNLSLAKELNNFRIGYEYIA